MKQYWFKIAGSALALALLSAMGLLEWWTAIIIFGLGLVIWLVKNGRIFLYLAGGCLLLIPLLLAFNQTAAVIAGNLAFIGLVVYAGMEIIQSK